jgi:hypothetical protein
LSGEHTSEQEVLGRFLFLVTKWESSFVRQTPLGEAIHCPNTSFNSKPKKEFATLYEILLEKLTED